MLLTRDTVTAGKVARSAISGFTEHGFPKPSRVFLNVWYRDEHKFLKLFH
jgi:hypothetical protein